MKTTLPILTLLMVLGGLLLGAERLYADQRVVFSLPAIPDAATSFDDLDARDGNNQPVVSPAAKEDLQSLFRDGLFTLLVKSEPPSVARALSIIRKALNLATQTLCHNIPRSVRTLLFTVFSSMRRQWGRALVSLPGLFGLIALAASFPLSRFFLPQTPLQTAPAVLRC